MKRASFARQKRIERFPLRPGDRGKRKEIEHELWFSTCNVERLSLNTKSLRAILIMDRDRHCSVLGKGKLVSGAASPGINGTDFPPKKWTGLNCF